MKQSLLAVFISLFAIPLFVSGQTNTAIVTDAYTDAQSSCIDLKYNMSYRSRDARTNGEVADLQDFLLSGGYLNVEPTGYFGALTADAVKKFQVATGLGNVGTPGFGGIGPKSRAKIKELTCGGVSAQSSAVVSTLTQQISTGTDNFPAGCTSTTAFSPLTGMRCVPAPIVQQSTPVHPPVGCNSFAGFSVVTGNSCSTSTTTTYGNQSSTVISEQVTCSFKSQTEQKCWGDAPAISVGSPTTSYSCSGVGTCLINVKGKHGTPIAWGSSCGGSANTTIDGNNEDASFGGCSVINQETTAPVIKGVSQNVNDNYLIIISGANFSPTSNEVKIDGKTHSLAPSKDGFTISFNDHGLAGRKMFQVVTSVGSNVVYADILQPKQYTVMATAPSVTLTASKTTLSPGEQTRLVWQSVNATACSLSGNNIDIIQNLPLSGDQTFWPNVTTTYRIYCSNSSATATESVTVNVTNATSAPALTVGFTPSTVAVGQSTTLTWSSTGATTCTGYENGSPAQYNPDNVGLNGSATQTASETKTYTFTCAGPGGSVTKSVTVTVAKVEPTPTLTFTATPSTVTAGQSATLTWSSTNATSCTTYLQGMEQYPPQNLGLSGSDTGSFYETRTHVVTCVGQGGSVTKSVTVTVVPAITNTNTEIPTVTIGTQTWMARNLNVGAIVTGTTGATSQTNNNVIEKYCYLNDSTNCTNQGGLYSWNEAMQYTTNEGSQGICPSGYHIPSDSDWKTLEKYLGMTQAQADTTGWRGTDQGTKLKAGGSSAFEAPLAGGWNTTGSFYGYDQSTNGLLWSSTMSGVSVWVRMLYSSYATVLRETANNQNYGFSVRCLKN